MARLDAGLGRVGPPAWHFKVTGAKGGRFLIIRVIVGRLARTRWYRGPALILGYQLDVILGGGPLGKMRGGFGLFGLLGGWQRPAP